MGLLRKQGGKGGAIWEGVKGGRGVVDVLSLVSRLHLVQVMTF